MRLSLTNNKLFIDLTIVALSLLIGAIEYILITKVNELVGFDNIFFISLAVMSTFIGIFLVFMNRIYHRFLFAGRNQIMLWSSVTLSLFVILSKLLNNNIGYLILISSVYSVFLYLCIYVGSSLKHNSSTYLSLIGGVFGGCLAGAFIGNIYLLQVRSLLDEGYFLLLCAILSMIGALTGVILSLPVSKSIELLHYSVQKQAYLNRLNKFILIFFVSIIVLLLMINLNNFWNNLDINQPQIAGACEDNPFIYCNISDNIIDYDNSNLDKCNATTDIVNFLAAKNNKTIDILGSLYLLSKNDASGNSFKESLLRDANNDKYIGTEGADSSFKFWQFDAMIRGYYYLEALKKNPHLFNASENKILLEWFRRINDEAFKVSWVDLVYGLEMKKIPDGPYANQEIGIGLLSVLSEIMKDEYLDIYTKDMDYINATARGWKYNFRNPDDGIVYHQSTWIKNAYVMARYGQQEGLIGNNSRRSFEWILLQWPPNGMSPAYNMPFDYTPYDVMFLGSQIFNDGRYLWLANKMLNDEMLNYNRTADSVLMTGSLNDSLVPIKPTVGSCYIEGTTGLAQSPGLLRPDKIVLRNGWNYDSLYALLNLRFSGWHSYKATNSLVTVMYGKPFIVEGLSYKLFSWLPRGKAVLRDKKIDRYDLNTLQIKKTGFQEAIYEITGFDSPWFQDTPRFADVVLINTTPIADYSMTKVSDWHGWDHYRTMILVKDEGEPFLIVADCARSLSPGETRITWHLKGNATTYGPSVMLTNGKYNMTIYNPSLNKSYEVKSYSENRSDVACEIHAPDLCLQTIARNTSEANYLTIMFPGGNRYLIDHDIKEQGILKINLSREYCTYGIKIDPLEGRVDIEKRN